MHLEKKTRSKVSLMRLKGCQAQQHMAFSGTLTQILFEMKFVLERKSVFDELSRLSSILFPYQASCLQLFFVIFSERFLHLPNVCSNVNEGAMKINCLCRFDRRQTRLELERCVWVENFLPTHKVWFIERVDRWQWWRTKLLIPNEFN